ncbi:hypothetical protein ACGRHY_30210 [Streptomyces sp. HK10]|uniref:hypothetical protein n=1 Tax=Streptomyces sp. HK10 TaxID=3373255 RepID=UPI0037481E8F
MSNPTDLLGKRRLIARRIGAALSAAVLVLLHLVAVYLVALAYAAGHASPWERDAAAHSSVPAGLTLVAAATSALLTWSGVKSRRLRRGWYALPVALAAAALLRLTLLAPDP